MKKIIITVSVIIVILTSFFILRYNSFALAIKKAGYSSLNFAIIEKSFNDNGNQFVIGKTNDSFPALLYLEKDNMGFWHVIFTGGDTSPSRQITCIAWMKQRGIKYYNQQDNMTFETEKHCLYYGQNAIKLIQLPETAIPSGVAVNIQQSGKEYFIHTISNEPTEVLNNIDMYSILLENHFIE